MPNLSVSYHLFLWLFSTPFLTAHLTSNFFTIVCCPPGPYFIRSTLPLITLKFIFSCNLEAPLYFPTFLLPPCLLLGCLDGLQRAIYAFLCPNPGTNRTFQFHQTNPIYHQKSWYNPKPGLMRAVSNLKRRLTLSECCLHGAGWWSPPFPPSKPPKLTPIMDVYWINLEGRVGSSQPAAFAPEGAYRLLSRSLPLLGKSELCKTPLSLSCLVLKNKRRKKKQPVSSNSCDGNPPFLSAEMILPKC